MKTSKTIKIKINSLPEEAKIRNIIPGIKNDLIAAPPLCDAGCEVIFRKKDVLVKKDKTFLLGRWRDPINRLWRVPLIQEEKYTTIKNYHDILSEDNDNNQQNSDKDEFVLSPSHGYKKTEFSNNAYFCKTEEQSLKFYRATCFSHLKSTRISAIREVYYKGCPGLNVTNAAK